MSIAEVRQATDHNQRRASAPQASVWVSANAGTGKTYVLVRRVLRLLLSGATPERILCLTYTRAAAAEMQNRLLAELSRWIVLDDAALRDTLRDLIGEPPEDSLLKTARRLFAGALEAQGGLRIYTIHGFCERVLQRFPLEAGVPAEFSVLEEHEKQSLLKSAVDAILDAAATDRPGPLGQALTAVVAAAGEDQFTTLIEAVIAKQDELRALSVAVADTSRFGEAEELALRRILQVPPGTSEAQLYAAIEALCDSDNIGRCIAALRGGAATGRQLADRLETALKAASLDQRLVALKAVFFTKAGAPRSDARFVTKAIEENAPQIAELLKDMKRRYDLLAAQLAGLQVAQVSAALLTLAQAVIQEYEQRKLARAALDYDDLITKTTALLRTRAATAWVLYKLDGGIDHILVDEAQDTSPAQWQVIRPLASEFFAGEGAREVVRTLFIVGDEKQSIFSFQGADPAAFAAHRREFESQARAAGRSFDRIPLTLSFRSTQAVLDCVDAVFAQEHARPGLGDNPEPHTAMRQGHAGLVEVWPIEEPAESEPAPPFEPLRDEGDAANPVETLANRIADTIERWVKEGTERLESEDRPIRAGDVMILLRRREPFVRPMIRALKARNIPVAGADRMTLGDQLAVMDLMALGDVLLLPEDDLSLATVLKSPLFGLDDDHLFALAHERRGSLWRALHERRGEQPLFEEAAAMLDEWLRRVDYLPPYEFYAGLLEEHGMRARHRLLARLGPDAGDALDEFLNLALSYERRAAPTLQGFLDWMRSTQAEVKRDMEQGRDEVRIMTVHGAKGLEAPIVFLPDTCGLPKSGGQATLLSLPQADAPAGAPQHIVWVPPDVMPLEPITQAKERRRQAELEEYRRLLYVAMTRARDRLYVCGWRGGNKPSAGNWHELVVGGLKELLTEAKDAAGRPVWRYHRPQDPQVPPIAAPSASAPERAAPLPDWARRPAAAEPPRRVPLTPSSLLPLRRAAPAAGEQSVDSPLHLIDQRRFLRGELVHALLQYLPGLARERRAAAARALLARRGHELDADELDEIARETLAILDAPQFADLFGPDSLAEVPIVARIGEGAARREVSGQIDRLLVRPHEVLIVDFKTNRPPPQRPQDVAPAYIAQLAAYRLALRALYPDKSLRCALLWTAAPRLMAIPEALLEEAERHLLPAVPGHAPAD